MSSITDFCRELRRNETSAEKLLWQRLRNRRVFAQKILRQYPIGVQSSTKGTIYYIADFYCHEAKLVIEADGPVHLLKKDYDQNRDEVLAKSGLQILRFENDLILNNTGMVLNKIKAYL
ncbi:endonuclease domain-containing protein [Mucilaginibacter sp. OK283]|jgi:very-short-patch-repair endonuclease|uniref:endonuclease domain-containing protein n=1 Tax=Mucilaginibacter sp. OK283 TaxID=1881049 RepID=UPI0008AE8141|nr:endonuclease domain-containing protein [Mucilaginibacter sp. OK283]SEO42448.1 Very-short-patch-repair endonuclease [Mucilaginibacter sp. OK283]